MPTDPRAIGLPASPRRSCFHPRRRLHRPTVPPGLSDRVHSLVSQTLFGVPSSALPAAPFGRHVLPGFLPSSRHHRSASTCARAHPLSLRSVLRLSLPLDGFLRHPASRACCIPQPRPGFSRPGVSPDPQPYRLVAGRCPRAVVARALTGKPAATRVRLDSEAFIRGPMRSAGSVFSLARARSPLRFLSSFRLRSRAVGPVPRALRP
jgi:hypothetical protein